MGILSGVKSKLEEARKNRAELRAIESTAYNYTLQRERRRVARARGIQRARAQARRPALSLTQTLTSGLKNLDKGMNKLDKGMGGGTLFASRKGRKKSLFDM